MTDLSNDHGALPLDTLRWHGLTHHDQGATCPFDAPDRSERPAREAGNAPGSRPAG